MQNYSRFQPACPCGPVCEPNTSDHYGQKYSNGAYSESKRPENGANGAKSGEEEDKMFYWVMEDSDPRKEDVICVDAKKVTISDQDLRLDNKVGWVYTEDNPGPKEDDVLCAEDVQKIRSVRGRKATAAVKDFHKLQKQLNRLRDLSDPDLTSDHHVFDFPSFIREPQKGDLLCWQGASSKGPQEGLRAVWLAEEMTDEPGKICWIGKEVSDKETEAVFRYDLKNSTPQERVWKSKPGFCLPPIAPKDQIPIGGEAAPPRSSIESLQFVPSDKTHQIPDSAKTVSWQDLKPLKPRKKNPEPRQ